MDLRSLPSVDALSRSPALADFPERVRLEAARLTIDEMRSAILGGASPSKTAEDAAAEWARELTEASLRRAINLSGVILHTGLGRARLAKAAVAQIRAVAESHAPVEFDVEGGKRGDRQIHVRDLLTRLTGAEDAMVVNNAAGAVVLTLRALAADRDIVLSRGQMVEIGGAFRMPDIVRESGCRLVEVGCTNKTHLSDYEDAIHEGTGAILRCHTSNYKVIGFTDQPSLAELASLAHAKNIPSIDDMGTGCIVDLKDFGLDRVPTMQDSLKAGADVVIGSGDKMLGGPQAGIILGSRRYLDIIRKHPMARAVRIDKLCLAGLEATLRLYTTGREREIPTIRYLSRPLEEVRQIAIKLASCPKSSTLAEGTTEVGAGSAPDTSVATWRVGLTSLSAEGLAKKLREAEPPIISRIEDGLVWLDPRTLDDEEVDTVCEVLRSL